MKRTKEHKIEWTGKMNEEEFSDILFDELIVRKADIKKIKFNNVHFKNCHLGFNSQYSNCVFDNCKFFGKYSSLGKPAKYTKCRFENCEFIGIDLFTGLNFYDCTFSGVMKNPILKDKHPKIDNNETVFKDCDLSALTFENVSIYGKEIFNNCVIPTSGIRLFDNADDKLIQRADDICSIIETDDKIESEIIFKRDLKQGQNPIILDKYFLDSFFKTVESKKLFDKIVNGYELKE